MDWDGHGEQSLGGQHWDVQSWDPVLLRRCYCGSDGMSTRGASLVSVVFWMGLFKRTTTEPGPLNRH